MWINKLSETSSQKQSLRKQFRTLRRNLSAEEKQQAAINIAQHLIDLPVYQKAEQIGVYSALGEEASLATFSELAWKDEKDLFLPKIDQASTANQMHFYPWLPDMCLLTNSQGISEPETGSKEKKAIPKTPQFNLLLLPLVAYDKKGHRLGMGGGFYDRYIEKYISKNCQLIGIAFSCQQAQELPHAKWDKNLHAVVNEKEVIYFD